MSINITMPALSPTMEEGTLAKWLVKEGDTVSSGDIIAEIETDKATMEVESVDEGIIAKILVAEGTEGVKVNAVIAVLAEEGRQEARRPACSSGKAASCTGTKATNLRLNACLRRPHQGQPPRQTHCRPQGHRPLRPQRLRPARPHYQARCRKRPARHGCRIRCQIRRARPGRPHPATNPRPPRLCARQL
jgi:pyruvate/2-oxoglutarate dehydrogenase complex dihydrolipoamide acyltransferase (E2) component